MSNPYRAPPEVTPEDREAEEIARFKRRVAGWEGARWVFAVQAVVLASAFELASLASPSPGAKGTDNVLDLLVLTIPLCVAWPLLRLSARLDRRRKLRAPLLADELCARQERLAKEGYP